MSLTNSVSFGDLTFNGSITVCQFCTTKANILHSRSSGAYTSITPTRSTGDHGDFSHRGDKWFFPTDDTWLHITMQATRLCKYTKFHFSAPHFANVSSTMNKIVIKQLCIIYNELKLCHKFTWLLLPVNGIFVSFQLLQFVGKAAVADSLISIDIGV